MPEFLHERARPQEKQISFPEMVSLTASNIIRLHQGGDYVECFDGSS